MQNATILLLMDEETDQQTISEFAVAASNSGSRLSCLVLDAGQDLPSNIYGVPPYGALNVPDNWGEMLEERHRKTNEKLKEIRAILAEANASGEALSAFCVTSEIKHHVARKARVADVAYLASNLRDTPNIINEAVHGVLFRSPIGLITNARIAEPVKHLTWHEGLPENAP